MQTVANCRQSMLAKGIDFASTIAPPAPGTLTIFEVYWDTTAGIYLVFLLGPVWP